MSIIHIIIAGLCIIGFSGLMGFFIWLNIWEVDHKNRYVK